MPSRLNAEAADLLSDRRHEVYLSVASAWEIVIKHGLGKLSIPLPPGQYIPDRVAVLGYRVLSIEQRHVLRVAELPPHHKDPFDRILVAQAQVDDLQIVTGDRLLTAYDVPTIWAVI
jgi:PIN domain nuclease of toxin-antitoxin system